MNIEYLSNITAFLTTNFASISLFLLKKTRKHKDLDKIKSAQLERYSVIINAEDEALRLVKEGIGVQMKLPYLPRNSFLTSEKP